MPGNVKAKIKHYEQALINSGGFITGAAKQLGISSQSLCNKIASSPHLQKVRDSIRESYLDLCETKLIEKIHAGDLGAICFYLKCQGKGRGYVERQEVSGAGGGPITIEIVKFTDKESEKGRREAQ